jgi:serine/threonine protein kinase
MALPGNSKRKIFDGRYEILSIVGRGADSVVYHGRYITGAAQEVAIKVLTNRDGTTTLTDKLRREALTLVSCRHKYVVRLDDFHSIQDLCYLSMEYAPQGDLLKCISTLPGKRLPPAQTELYLKQCLEALDFVHATGVTHRDIKPDNILVLSDKEIRLADFGLALLPGDDVQLEELRKAVGSFDYLAPEVLDGIKYDTTSDLYSLGVCFYEAATGKHPFAHVPIAERREARKDERVTPIAEVAPDVPPHVAAVITTLMRFSERDRFQSTSDALRALDNPEFRATQRSSETSETSSVRPANDDVTQTNIAEIISAPGFSESANQKPHSNASREVHPSSSYQPTQQSSGNEAVALERQPIPTEKIDLERIKAIIARDTERRTGAATGGEINPLDGAPVERTGGERVEHTGHSTTAHTADGSVRSSQMTEDAVRAGALAINRSSKNKGSSSGFGATGTSLLATALARFVGVALAFAVLTVGGLYGYHALTQRGLTKATDHTEVQGITTTDHSNPLATTGTPRAEENTTELHSLSKLPEGVYSGAIRGLFPEENVPMALISSPKQQQLTLLVGLEGWIPATITIPSEDSTDTEGPTFRSNGLILKFNQESSSSAITGTVIDVVTGEAGTWKISG